ncbi:protein DDB G0276689-like [Aphis craccivora]|uniref:Protein DDB G0276689-like n=1 Tax=Aphis craccivora TaxID=307492 RepID=A0A6G0VUK0_APHCR|nr:protein DDB G0276689-like [Aphis craccivora]
MAMGGPGLSGPLLKSATELIKVGSNSSGEETDKTREIGTEVELNKNIEVKKLSSRIKYNIYSREQEFNKEKYSDNIKGNRITFKEDSSTKGLRSTPNIVHTELRPVKRKQRTKMSSITAVIPIYADAKDVCSFIWVCNYACEAVYKDNIPITGKALKVCRYREISNYWDQTKN